MGSILCCQSLCVIESCSVSPFSWLTLCHLGGLNLVLSIIFCHWLLFCESFFSLFFCHLCGLLFCESFFLTLSLSLLWSQSCVVNHSVSLTLVLSVHFSDSFFVSILCCQSLSVIDSCFCLSFSSLMFCHLCGLNLVLSVVLCHWLLFCESFFFSFFLCLFCGLNILCCQWFSVIDSCFVFCHVSSLIFCHLCGLNLVLSVVLCHWLLFCESFFSHSFSVTLVVSILFSHSLSIIYSCFLSVLFPHSFSLTFVGSILCCQSLCVIDSCSVSPFSWLILCHFGGLNLVLSITFCHWLLFCESFFLINFLSPLWALVLWVLFSHPFSVTLVVSILCCQSLCVIDSCMVSPFFSFFLCFNLVLSVTLCHWFLFFLVCPFFSFFLCNLGGLNLVLSVTLCYWVLFCQSMFLIFSLLPLCCQSLSVSDSCFLSVNFPYWFSGLLFWNNFGFESQKNQTWLPDRCSSGHIDPLGWAPIYTMPVQAYVVLPSKQHCTLWCGIWASSNQNLSKVIPLERQHNHTLTPQKKNQTDRKTCTDIGRQTDMDTHGQTWTDMDRHGQTWTTWTDTKTHTHTLGLWQRAPILLHPSQGCHPLREAKWSNGGGSFAPSPQGSLCKLSPQRFICPTPIGVGRPMLWGNSVQKMEKLVVLGLVSPKVFICKVLRQPSIVLQMGIPCPLELT